MNSTKSLSIESLCTLSKIKASKLLIEKVETKLLAVCSITGIAITIEAPAIEGMALDYSNPIAEPRNFLALSLLPSHQLAKLDAPILSGIYLALVKYYELLECPLSSAAQNLSLQSVHPLTLIDSIKFFSTALPELGSKKLASLPKFSLANKDISEVQNSSITSVVKNAHTRLKDIIYPVQVSKELLAIEAELAIIRPASSLHLNRMAKAVQVAQKSKQSNQLEAVRAARLLTKELAEAGILSEKLIAFLKVLFYKDTLFNAEQETKDRVIKALTKHQNSACVKLIAILKDTTLANTVDTIFAQDNDIEVEESLQEVEKLGEKKLSLAEIIAARKAGN